MDYRMRFWHLNTRLLIIIYLREHVRRRPFNHARGRPTPQPTAEEHWPQSVMFDPMFMRRHVPRVWHMFHSNRRRASVDGGFGFQTREKYLHVVMSFSSLHRTISGGFKICRSLRENQKNLCYFQFVINILAFLIDNIIFHTINWTSI